MRRLLLILLLMSASTGLMAQTVFRWVDENGEVHYGHAVPPEHTHRGYDRLRPDGTVAERIARTLTPEERAEIEREEARQAEAEAEQRSQDSRDRLLLASYDSEQDIRDQLDAQLRTLDTQRQSINQALGRVSERFESLITRAAQFSREGESVPPPLSQSIEATRRESRRLRDSLDELARREATLRQRYTAEMERFRQLTGGES
ncbi:MAG: DUF4124 domain-containing protein [Wenzhouxiangella sp.]|jgi:hypothetical protein|nr:DUF4124 domain-containing protein [Wenzhouxiangella sp.]